MRALMLSKAHPGDQSDMLTSCNDLIQYQIRISTSNIIKLISSSYKK